jgi:hypothetical protein
MKARMIFLQITAVIALYVLVSMAAALARFPGQEVEGKSGYRDNTAVTITDPGEADELKTEHIVP